MSMLPYGWCNYERKPNCPAPPPPPSPPPPPPPPVESCPGVSVSSTWYTGYSVMVWGPNGQKATDCEDWCLSTCLSDCAMRRAEKQGMKAFCGFREIRGPCNTEAECEAKARSLGLGIGYPGARRRSPRAFAGEYSTKGCHAFASGTYRGMAFWGRGGTESENTAALTSDNGEALYIPMMGQVYRPCEASSNTGMCGVVAGFDVGKVAVTTGYYTAPAQCLINVFTLNECERVPVDICEEKGIPRVEATLACQPLLNTTAPGCDYDSCVYDFCALGGDYNMAAMAESCLGMLRPNPPDLPPPLAPPSMPPPAGPPPPGTCKDDPSYRDPLTGWGCADWAGFPCRTGAAPTILSPAQIDRLVAACPETCSDVTPECSCEACDLVKFDFSMGRISIDNFDGQGIGGRSTPKEIRYSKVASYLGRYIDVVITARKSYDCGGTVADACLAGGGQTARYWGGIGVRRGDGRELYGRITLRYTDTNAEAVVPVFCLTFVDIGRGDGPIEYLTIGGFGSAGSSGTIFSSYALGRDLRVNTGLSLWGQPALRFRASTNKGMPNPHYVKPMDLSDRQKAASVRVHFENTASLDFVFGTLSTKGCCQRMWFAGNSLIEGTCPQITPNPSPPPPSPPPLPPNPSLPPPVPFCVQSATVSGGFGCSNTPYLAEGGRGDFIHTPESDPAVPQQEVPQVVLAGCELPKGTLDYSIIVKEDAQQAAHAFYGGIAVGGKLVDASPQQSATVATQSRARSYVGQLWGNRWSFKGGITYGQFPFDFSAFEMLAKSLKSEGSKVLVRDQGGEYDQRNVCTKRYSGLAWAQGEVSCTTSLSEGTHNDDILSVCLLHHLLRSYHLCRTTARHCTYSQARGPFAS